MKKFRGGPGSYNGVWELIAQKYRAQASGSAPPVTTEEILIVDQLVEALKPRVERT